MLPSYFDSQEQKTVLVLCNSPEEQKNAREEGATLVGGTELIRQVFPQSDIIRLISPTFMSFLYMHSVIY